MKQRNLDIELKYVRLTVGHANFVSITSAEYISETDGIKNYKFCCERASCFY